MNEPRRSPGWFPYFRRSVAFLYPHRAVLVIGLITSLGVSVSYTVSISAVVPILKVIFAQHESLADWLRRAEVQRRLGVTITGDLPDRPDGLPIERVRPGAPVGGVLREGDRLIAVNERKCGTYEAMAVLAAWPDENVRVRVRTNNGDERDVTLRLKASAWWWWAAERAAGWLPTGRDPASRMQVLALVMGGLVGVSLVGGLCRLTNDGLVHLAVQRAMHDIRSRVAGHVLRLPLAWHSAQPAGDTLARLATDLGKVEVGQTTLFGKAVREPLNAIGVLTLALLIDWRLLVVAVVGLPIGVLVLRTFGRLVKRAQRRASQSWGRLLDHLGERLAGIRVVKAYNMQDAESRRFEQEGRTLTRAQTHIEFVDAATHPALELLAMVAVAVFVLYGGSRVFQQQLEPHLFFAAVVCLGGVFDPVRKMGNVNNRLQAADVAARRLFELLDLPTEEAAAPATAALPPFERTIEFRQVSFAYPGNPRPVLHEVSLAVRKGEMVAIVGPNGSGKTTLVSLLARFFEPTSGRILIDDRDVSRYSAASLRAQLGLVTQDAVIFSGTLRENIAYGVDGAADEAVRQAARLAHVDELARQPGTAGNGAVRFGYDAHVSTPTLSGGQRQRIALARAILRDPPILILDEATSQVDSESERKIQEALEDVTRDRTTFVIAHRFSTIARADRVVVLNEGRVIAVGRHEELLRTCPFYATLCQTQFAASGPSPGRCGASE